MRKHENKILKIEQEKSNNQKAIRNPRQIRILKKETQVKETQTSGKESDNRENYI